MPHDEIAASVLIGSLAAWGTLHGIVCAKVAGGGRWWRAPVAFVVAPLAPYWAARDGHRAWAGVWCLACLASLISRLTLAR